MMQIASGTDWPGLRDTCALCCLVIMLATSAAPSALAQQGASLPPAGSADDQLVCGPRCVKFILQAFGKDVDLTELIIEAQWPNLRDGASLEVLAGSLKKRGIHVLAISVAHLRTKRLVSPYPILLHIAPDESGLRIGHYVVWLPCSATELQRVWDPMTGSIGKLRWETLCERLSGAMLLCAPHAIGDPAFAIVRHRFFFRQALISSSMLWGIVVITWSGLRFLRRSSDRHPKSLGSFQTNEEVK
jgi:ABC-type bacteriocin/lantibiotic exporter with double-glycine peptidase domain